MRFFVVINILQLNGLILSCKAVHYLHQRNGFVNGAGVGAFPFKISHDLIDHGLLYVLRVGELYSLFAILILTGYIFAEKRKGYFPFCADDLAGVGGLAFGNVKAPGAIYNHFVFKQYLPANMVIGRGGLRLIQ